MAFPELASGELHVWDFSKFCNVWIICNTNNVNVISIGFLFLIVYKVCMSIVYIIGHQKRCEYSYN